MSDNRNLHSRFIKLKYATRQPDGLPKGLEVTGEQVFFGGQRSEREIEYRSIREDGPDAWGVEIPVPANAYYRWADIFGSKWARSVVDGSAVIGYDGSRLDVVYVEPASDRLVFKSYIGDSH